MTDREKAGFKGAVRVARDDRFHSDPKTKTLPDKPSSSTEWRYAGDGLLEAVVHINPDGSRHTSLYLYDHARRLTEIQYPESGSALRYEHDEKNRVLRQVAVKKSGSETVHESFRYEPDGSYTRTHFVPAELIRKKIGYGFQIEGSELGAMAARSVSFTVLYDARGCPTEMLSYGERHTLQSRVRLQCDEAGRILEERTGGDVDLSSVFDGKDDELPPDAKAAMQKVFAKFMESFRAAYRYDEQGRRIEVRREEMDGSSLTTRTYDAQGNLVRQHSISDSRGVDFDLDGNPLPGAKKTPRTETTTEYRYRYDDRGNWLEQTQTINGHVNLLARRAIEYF